MKAKIGVIFQALQIAEGQNKSGLEAQARYGGDFPDYGKLLALRSILSQSIAECEIEIELPLDAENLLVPFLAVASCRM